MQPQGLRARPRPSGRRVQAFLRVRVVQARCPSRGTGTGQRRHRRGRMSYPLPAYRTAAPSRTMLCQDRAEAATVLLEHGLDRDEATGLLDFAELHGDGQVARARVRFGGDTWTVDLFGQRK